MGMREIYLVKFGGNALGEGGLEKLCAEAAELQKEGISLVFVHGGGPAINAELERRGIVPRKVAGKRITDGPTMEVVESVLRSINGDIVAAMEKAGVRCVGMPGYFVAESRKDEPMTVIDEGKEMFVDYGLTGVPVKVDAQVIYDLVDDGVAPVIYPVGSDGTQHLNVNADTMAAAVAAATGVKEMIAVTDVPGILRDVKDPSSKIDTVTLSQIDAMVKDGTISGGMIPKVIACRKAVEAGAESVRMVSGRTDGSIITGAIRGEPVGTLIVKGRSKRASSTDQQSSFKG